MTIPSEPSRTPPPTPHTPPSQVSQSPPQAEMPTSYVDPTGAWAKFLSGSGTPATADDVKRFIDGILKTFNVLIQQQQAAAKRAADVLKKSAEGG